MSSLRTNEQPNDTQKLTYRFPDQPPIPFSQSVHPIGTDLARLSRQEKPLFISAPLGPSICDNGLKLQCPAGSTSLAVKNSATIQDYIAERVLSEPGPVVNAGANGLRGALAGTLRHWLVIKKFPAHPFCPRRRSPFRRSISAI